MKILIFTFYFKPDLCAGSFRMSAFVDALQKRLNSEDRVDIFTTMPNRYATFSTESLKEEQLSENIYIRRIKMPEHKSGFMDQARSFTVYFFSALKWSYRRDYDYVFSTTSRLFTGFLGAVIAKIKKRPLYLDVRDIFTDTMDSLLPGYLSFVFLPFFKLVEKFTMVQATKINMVSQGFKRYIHSVSNEADFSFYTNGIDDIFLETAFRKTAITYNNKTVITYAGNIGKGQRLDRIVPDMAELLGEDYLIQIVGDGGIRHLLEAEIYQRKLNNVVVENPVDRNTLVDIYKNSDWLFLHLDDCRAFEKVLPSKIFEYAATGKPVIAGVAGYSAEFIKDNVQGSVVFNPCDAEDFYNKFKAFNEHGFDRSLFLNQYKRETIMTRMVEDVLAVGKKG